MGWPQSESYLPTHQQATLEHKTGCPPDCQKPCKGTTGKTASHTPLLLSATFSIKHYQQQQGARKNFSSEERSQAPNSMKPQFDQTKIVICVRNNLKAEAKKWKTTNCEGGIWKAKLRTSEEVSPKLEAGLDNGDHWTLKLNPLDFQVSPPPLITTAFPC